MEMSLARSFTVLGSVGVLTLGSVACNRSGEPPPSAVSSAQPVTTAPAAVSTATVNTATPVPGTTSEATATAEVGSPAPDFTLTDVEGKSVRLADHKGKIVVLEWFNPGCPFVKKSHTLGSLVTTAKKQTAQGVVWLAVNSGSPGAQGHGVDANKEGAKTFSLTHPILLDESGKVGRSYGATNTPHMFVIDTKGVLAYRGAIDNSPDGEGQSAPGGKVVNYVDAAVASLKAGKPVEVSQTKAYGCGVKYGK